MLSALFLFFAVVHIVILVGTLRYLRATRSWVVLMAVLPLLLLWYDCLIIGLGRFIGPGELLEMLSLPRYWAHWLLTPFWIMAGAGILRMSGSPFGQPRWVMVGLAVLTAVMIAIEIPLFFTLELRPVCFMDTVRYAESVSANALCFPEQEVVPGSGPPIPPVITNIVLLAVGGIVWYRLRWIWLSLGAAVMWVAAIIPTSLVGPGVGNFGEIVLALAILATIRYLHRLKSPDVTEHALDERSSLAG